MIFFKVLKDIKCDKCGSKIRQGNVLREVKEKVYCLKCSGMEGLVLLPAGDRTLTVRAKKLSKLSAVVLKWNKIRKCYERQGLLVGKKALTEARRSCAADKDIRKEKRKKAAVYAAKADLKYKKSFATAVTQAYPGCGIKNAGFIAEHACEKYSGRVGRSAAAKKLEPQTINLAVRAFIRHNMTEYESLFEKGYFKTKARKTIIGQVNEIAEKWKHKTDRKL
jgi:hypothetical protein